MRRYNPVAKARPKPKSANATSCNPSRNQRPIFAAIVAVVAISTTILQTTRRRRFWIVLYLRYLLLLGSVVAIAFKSFGMNRFFSLRLDHVSRQLQLDDLDSKRLQDGFGLLADGVVLVILVLVPWINRV